MGISCVSSGEKKNRISPFFLFSVRRKSNKHTEEKIIRKKSQANHATSMIRTRYCIAISVMVASLGIVWGSSVSITAHQDEALWTKRLWNKFKLEFPYSFFAGDDPEHAETGHLLVGKEHSLAGPWSSDTLNRLEQDDDAK